MDQTRPITSGKSSRLVQHTPFFYGWVVLVAGTLGIIMTSPGQTYAVSIFTEHFITDLGLSRSLVSTLYAGGTLLGSLALPLVGRQIDRRGSRLMVVVIAALFGLACIYMGFVSSALMLGIGFVAIRMLGQGSLSLVSQNVINQWWQRRRGAVMGLSGVASSLLGLSAFPTLINALISSHGWRVSYGLLGGLLLLVMVPVGALFFRERPEQYGLQPDGRFAAAKAGLTPSVPLSAASWTLAEALHMPVFWIVAGSTAVIALASTGLFFHMVSLLSDSGLPPTTAAAVYTPIAVATAGATLGSGVLVDRIPLRGVLAVALLLLAAALGLAQCLVSVPLAVVYGLALGAAMGLYRIVTAVAWAHYSGRAHLGSISGAASTILIVGAAVGPIPMALARDWLGSYQLALSVLALLSLVLSGASLLVRPPAKASMT
jgi:MFS transporter, OFA family, oxalate/formate antiporter